MKEQIIRVGCIVETIQIKGNNFWRKDFIGSQGIVTKTNQDFIWIKWFYHTSEYIKNVADLPRPKKASQYSHSCPLKVIKKISNSKTFDNLISL